MFPPCRKVTVSSIATTFVIHAFIFQIGDDESDEEEQTPMIIYEDKDSDEEESEVDDDAMETEDKETDEFESEVDDM
jgi:U3 small nucleolar RNA-associated protein 5